MKSLRNKNLLAALGLLGAGMAALGCNTDGPEFLTGDTRIIEGFLLPEEEMDTAFFALTRGGTVSIQATRIEGTNPVTGDPIVNPILVVSIGAPDPENEDACQLTFAQVMEVGDDFSVYYRDGLFCTSISRNPGSIEEAPYEYVLTLTGAFS